MGHRNLNLAVLIAGFFTLGAVFGRSYQADASPTIVLPEVLILACEADDEPASFVAAACGEVPR